MLIRLDPGATEAIYQQIALAIAAQIDDGSLSPGQRLPSARAMADMLDVNMHTVLHAYSRLESDGLVEMRRGRGGVVVASTDLVTEAADRLVAEAKKRGLKRQELIKMVEEAW